MRLITFLRKLFLSWCMVEFERGTLFPSLLNCMRKRTIAPVSGMYYGEYIERKARRNKDKTLIYFYGQEISYRQANATANKVAHGLLEIGAKQHDGLAIMTLNSPRFLDVVFGTQKIGMYIVPTNVSLRVDGLAHVFENSEVSYLVIHHSLYEFFAKIKDRLPKIKTVVIDTTDAPEGYSLPDECIGIDVFYSDKLPETRPDVYPEKGDPAIIMYTSGTTGMPKGVVTRYGDVRMGMAEALGRAIGRKDDIYYTCLPLFHANALFITLGGTLAANSSLALGRSFSARGFWDEVRQYRATTFNLLGAMIPILLKQPPRPNDRDNNVRLVITSACPADMWADFENRFGVTIWEAYAGVDMGGVMIMNIGNAPKGSIGKPLSGKVRVADEDGIEVPTGERGELLAYIGEKGDRGTMEYHRNPEASSKKVRDGWIHTGDYVYRDKKGYLYFVGRDSESMRRRGENVSTYEVEKEILKHPSVQECAVFGVPSELTEEDIMTSLVLVEGKTLDPKELLEFLADKMAYFAIPRYVRIVEELKKTETHRVIKSILSETGVTEDTWDAEAHGITPKKLVEGKSAQADAKARN